MAKNGDDETLKMTNNVLKTQDITIFPSTLDSQRHLVVHVQKFKKLTQASYQVVLTYIVRWR